ncbi:MAG: hypothetical protein IJN84_06950 [Clostridia bacterium]|nr:hypothetical protein [Clostridia bacterium]
MAYDNAKLVELFEKIQRKNHLEDVLKELRENIAQLEPEVRKLMTQMYIEQEDVDKIEGNGLKSFFYSLTGRKHDIIDKERQEAYDAKKKYDAANFQLETMKNDLKRYIDEYNEVRYLEPEYEKAIKEKIELIKAKGSIEAEKIAEFDKQIDEMMNKNNELRQVRTAGNGPVGTAREIIAVLQKIHNMAEFDAIARDGDYKRRELNREAEYLTDRLYGEVRKFGQMMAKSGMNTDVEINQTKYLNNWDIFGDGFISNMVTITKLGKAIDRISAVEEGLQESLLEINTKISQIEAKQKEFYRQRDEIVRNTEV